MNTFILHLQDAAKHESVDGVSSFVGEDGSGSFGIKAGHGRFMTSLVFGLARFRIRDEPWQYLALPGGLLYFRDQAMSISTRRYLVDSDYERISAVLAQELVAEEAAIGELKRSLRTMEQEMLRRIWRLRHPSEVGL